MTQESEKPAEGASAEPAPATMAKPKGQVVPVHLIDKNAVYAAFMPFVKNGGLFVESNNTFALGDEVFLVVRLLDAPEKFHLPGKVVWITPKGAQGGKKAGIGVQFDDESAAHEFRRRIDTYLAGASNDKRTDTM